MDAHEDVWDEPPPIHFSGHEILHLLASVVVLTVAFALVLGARVDHFPSIPEVDFPKLLDLLPYAAVAVVPAFILHELAHKLVAQRKDMWAEFRASAFGLVGGFVFTAWTGFLFTSPGAVEIVGNATKRDAGVISIVGPMVNLAIGAIAVLLHVFPGSLRVGDFGDFRDVLVFLNVLLAAFNMLPIGPLDGRKVLRWSWLAFVGIWALIAALAIFGVLFSSASFTPA